MAWRVKVDDVEVYRHTAKGNAGYNDTKRLVRELEALLARRVDWLEDDEPHARRDEDDLAFGSRAAEAAALPDVRPDFPLTLNDSLLARDRPVHTMFAGRGRTRPVATFDRDPAGRGGWLTFAGQRHYFEKFHDAHFVCFAEIIAGHLVSSGSR